MQTAYYYLVLSGVLTLMLWTPYILARVQRWGLGAFIRNYTGDFPANEPAPPLWAQRAKRAHLNLVETLPAFAVVLIAAPVLDDPADWAVIGQYAALFFYARVAHAAVYIAGTPYLRTPIYLASWAAILLIAATLLG